MTGETIHEGDKSPVWSGLYDDHEVSGVDALLSIP